MAFADSSVYDSVGDGSIIGVFHEKDTGNLFEFSDNQDMGEWAGYSYPHKIWVTSPKDGIDSGYRYGRVKKTLVEIVVDEDSNGDPIVEKWAIKNLKVYADKTL